MTFSKNIIAWFKDQGRKNLPWQKNRTPYRVWISEIMLQQTQVGTVIPYYARFMDRFPTIEALANAPLDEVLSYWTGLGYYARARNLHRTAIILWNIFHGQFPTDFENVIELPGIGRSTAGAILALSMNKRFPILDGNVKRVLCRYFVIEGAPNKSVVEKELWALAESLLPKTDLRSYTQGLMDLGATLCTTRHPQCDVCPLQLNCEAKKQERVLEFPESKIVPKKPIKATQFFILYVPKQQAVLLEKRPNSGIWGGLYGFPEHESAESFVKFCKKNLNLKLQAPELFTEFRHTFTHFHLNIKAQVCYCTRQSLPAHLKQKFHWQSLNQPLNVGVSQPVQRILKELRCHVSSIVSN